MEERHKTKTLNEFGQLREKYGLLIRNFNLEKDLCDAERYFDSIIAGEKNDKETLTHYKLISESLKSAYKDFIEGYKETWRSPSKNKVTIILEASRLRLDLERLMEEYKLKIDLNSDKKPSKKRT